MMKQQFKCCVWLILMLLGMTQTAHAAFQNFAVELRDASGGILTSDETSNSQTITFGLAVDVTTGAVSRVAADDASAVAVITGKTGNDHGLQNFSATVPVDGSVKITMSTCSWGGTVSVKDGSNTEVVTFSTQKGSGGDGCYVGGGATSENIISQKYLGDATTLTISGGGYVGYFAIEAVQASSATVSYSLGDVVCEGTVVPTGGTYAVGDSYTIPAKNFTLYKEGYTLTGWTDGTNTYNAGQSYELTGDLALTPVFTQNTVSLADRTDAVTLKWDFQRNNGAPTLNYGGNATGVYVTQAVVNGSTIDVKLDFNTGGSGKIANANWGDWCQMNNGTTYTIPSCKDAVVSVEAFNALGTGDSPLTIDGQSDYTSAKTVSYTIANTANAIDVVIGSEGSYYRYIQTVLPVVEQSGGTSYTNEAATVTWAMTDANNPSAYTAAPDGVFRTITFDKGDTEITGTSNITDENAQKVTTGIKFRPSGTTQSLVWGVKPAAGLTFTPTKLSGYVNRCGTDAENGIKVSVYVGENEPTLLGTWTALRSGKTNTQKPYDATAIYKYEITLTSEQQAALASGDGFYLTSTVGVGAAKEGAFGEVKIEGLINGTVQDVPSYTLYAAPSDEGAGTVTVYPAGGTYNEGDEVKLTATPNFGYHFVNWTDGENNVLSTDAVYNHEMTADIAVTANFEAVQTYELALTVDGTNDYMVTIDPLPTIVNDKMMYEAGTVVTLTANQYAGLVTFNNWSDAETNSQKTITMDENKTYTAVYSQNDIIAGWDFYKAGGSGRVADFAAAENDADALQLINTETGATSGWLDKSTVAAGGYESFKGAAVNWRTGASDGDVGNWHWQTKVNAEAFQDINVQFQMMYNYNAYQKYNAEYSLDGENWTNFGSIEMTGAKAAASFSEQLPAACNNQANLYIRMIADKASNVDGAVSANDGNTLAMFFITGTEQVAYDAVAPALVSTIPANNGTGASATGRIVLTFDKKVQLATNTIVAGDLSGISLTPTVTGKSVTFNYSQLDYNTAYTFTLPANSIENLSGVALGEAVTINFTTMARPTVEKGLYDAVVSNVTELLQAIDDAAQRADKNVRYRIFIKNGNYTIPLYSTMKTCNGFDVQECITFLTNSHNNVSFIGESRDGVVITNDIPADATFAGTYGPTSKYDGIGNSDVFQSRAEGLYWQDLTVSTGMEDSRGRDIAIQDKGNKTIYKNVCLHGYQDTWTSNSAGLFYFEGGIVRGRTDYLCGKGDAFFNGVELLQVGTGGYPIVPSQPKSIGWVFKDCELTPETSDVKCTLGRPWGNGTPAAYLIDTKMNVVPDAVGWSEMSDGWPYRFAEYNSTTASGTVIDLSSRRTTFGGHENCNNPVLTAEEAAYYSDMSNMFGDWQPTLATEQAPVPTDVELNGTTLSWTGSDYALLYAICKNGSVVDFTTVATFEVDDPTATWSVRAANEMGGLSEASEDAVAIDITLDENGGNSDKIEAANGQTVNVKVERTLSSQYYNTLFLPFAMTAEQIKAAFGEGVQVATFTGMNSETQFGFGNVTAMEANVPYLVKPAQEVNGFTVEGVTISNTTADGVVSGGYSMVGTYDTFTNGSSTSGGISIGSNIGIGSGSSNISDEIYYFATTGKIKKLKSDGSGSIKGLRAFMVKMRSGATSVETIVSNAGIQFGGGGSGEAHARQDFVLYLDDDNTTTGIEAIDNGQMINDNDAPVYNLAGQKVGKGYKGIVIKNGKKVVK